MMAVTPTPITARTGRIWLASSTPNVKAARLSRPSRAAATRRAGTRGVAVLTDPAYGSVGGAQARRPRLRHRHVTGSKCEAPDVSNPSARQGSLEVLSLGAESISVEDGGSDVPGRPHRSPSNRVRSE